MIHFDVVVETVVRPSSSQTDCFFFHKQSSALARAPGSSCLRIELFHVEDEPRIVRTGGAPGKNLPQIRALGFVRSHRCVGRSLTVRTPRKVSNEPIVGFAYPTLDGDPTTPFGG
jgi:hypothetical protein